jgi:hypothetical protein
MIEAMNSLKIKLNPVDSAEDVPLAILRFVSSKLSPEHESDQ